MEPTQRKGPSAGKSNLVDQEVARLLTKNVSRDEFQRLRSKYPNDMELVDRIQAAYSMKFAEIERRARIFAQKILEKYGMTNEPFSNLLLKAHKYKQKYDLSDDEFVAFKRILEIELVGAKRPDVPSITTNMGKVLGDITIDTKGFGMKVSDAEYRDVQDILRIHEETKPTHAQVIIQSLKYTDCDPRAINSRYDPALGHNLINHVHPVVAALFLPKIQYLEEYFLFSNMANVVKSRYEQVPFATRPDYELFYNMVTDPNDVVCDGRSPVKDLKNRVHLQKELWNAVLTLRNGHHFAHNQTDFMRAVELCRLNKFDTPDLVYGRYDGTVIKRLLAAFSFRPTIVASVVSPTIHSTNPYFNQTIHPEVSQITMINLRVGGQIGLAAVGPINLRDALTQPQLLFTNNMITQRSTDVIYSRGILTFFVDRRATTVRVGALQHPFNMGRMPVAASGFERLDDTRVNFDMNMTIRDQQFNLRSVVIAETTNVPDDENKRPIITGSSTYIFNDRTTPDAMATIANGQVFHYNPLDAIHATNKVPPAGAAGPPVREKNSVEIVQIEKAREESACRGIIFIYVSTDKDVKRSGITLS